MRGGERKKTVHTHVAEEDFGKIALFPCQHSEACAYSAAGPAALAAEIIPAAGSLIDCRRRHLNEEGIGFLSLSLPENWWSF